MFTATIALAFLSSAVAVISGYMMGYWQGRSETWREAADLFGDNDQHHPQQHGHW